ncbi:hypothetical protein Q1695_005725 [Nippostrongylus brasiliensis]|nr:hypothetical protein Q1695_005725 [Nippostrongylus brasiliensis]
MREGDGRRRRTSSFWIDGSNCCSLTRPLGCDRCALALDVVFSQCVCAVVVLLDRSEQLRAYVKLTSPHTSRHQKTKISNSENNNSSKNYRKNHHQAAKTRRRSEICVRIRKLSEK